MKGLLCVHFLYSQNHRDSLPKNIYLILIQSTSFSRYMQRLDMSWLYANEVGSRNYPYGGFLLLNIDLFFRNGFMLSRRSVLDFWGQLEPGKCAKMYILRLRVKYLICIKKRYRIPWRP